MNMKVFAANFLESPSMVEEANPEKWNWKPSGENIYKIYASGGNTNTRQSTYSDERDNRADHDRPQEGKALLVA